MLVSIAVTHFSWSLVWVITFFFQYFPMSDQLRSLISIGISVYHLISIFVIIVFYVQSYQFRKHLKLHHFEQKFWLGVGAFAAFANILKNIYTSEMGFDNLMTFIPVTVQNTLVYFASIYCIMILDGWNMESESRYVKGSVWVLIVSQTIINITLIMEAFYSYLTPPSGTLLQLFFLTIYRSWLIYFGWKKTWFLIRKCLRWNCELFIYANVYIRLPEKNMEIFQDEEPTRVLHSVSQRVTDLDSFLNPIETNYNDPSFQLQDPFLPKSSSFQHVMQ